MTEYYNNEEVRSYGAQAGEKYLESLSDEEVQPEERRACSLFYEIEEGEMTPTLHWLKGYIAVMAAARRKL